MLTPEYQVPCPEWLTVQKLRKGEKVRVALSIAKPFDKDNMPKRWLAMLIPLLSGSTTKVAMLKSAKYDVDKIAVDGYMTSYFSKFTKLEILKFDTIHKIWIQGPRFQEYMSYIFLLSMQNQTIRERFARSLRLGLKENNSVNFILDLEEEMEDEK